LNELRKADFSFAYLSINVAESQTRMLFGKSSANIRVTVQAISVVICVLRNTDNSNYVLII
jgi:hypothetical protein